MKMKTLIPVLAFVTACMPGDPFPLPDGPPGQQTTSLLGDPLVPSAAVGETNRANLEEAHANFVAAANDADAQIWLGRRFAYPGYYRTAIAIYSDGIEKHPEDARFLRHRGHRYITVREFDKAISDLTAAARLEQGQEDEIEPDGQPNELGIPTSTLQSNIWYHLGLAQYLQGDFSRALSSYQQDLELDRGPDGDVAARYWLYMIHRRMGNRAEAEALLEPINADMDVIENHAYHNLLLMFKGERRPEDMLESAFSADGPSNSAVAYGVGNWFLMNGDEEHAFEVFDRILETSGWAGFGYIAAEAEVARRRAE
jgi:tetratricopeptide (TPR) repeat protein